MKGVVEMGKGEDMSVLEGLICSCSDIRGVRLVWVVIVEVGANLGVFFRPSGVRRQAGRGVSGMTLVMDVEVMSGEGEE